MRMHMNTFAGTFTTVQHCCLSFVLVVLVSTFISTYVGAFVDLITLYLISTYCKLCCILLHHVVPRTRTAVSLQALKYLSFLSTV